MVLILTCILGLKAEAFGPGFNFTFGGDEARIDAYGMFPGQGAIPLPPARIKLGQPDISVREPKRGVYVVELNTKDSKLKLEPYVVVGTETNQTVFETTKAKLVFNAGFFDPKNKKTTSFVTRYGQIIADPRENENLTSNPELIPHLDTIYNRTEFRILKSGTQKKYDIAQHNDPIPEGWYLMHSLQAGPELVPQYKAENEFFLVKDCEKVVRDSISVTKKAARSAIGIKDGDVFLIAVTTKNPMTLDELKDFCMSLGLEKAMGFDGGGSTSLNYKDIQIISDKDNTARKLKSFLLVY